VWCVIGLKRIVNVVVAAAVVAVNPGDIDSADNPTPAPP